MALATLACLALAALALALVGPAGERLQIATRAIRLEEPGLAASSPAYVVATVLLSILVVAQTVYVARQRRS